jgi:hypothetical protein
MAMPTPNGDDACEQAQKQLDAYAVLDTPPEPEFDDLTQAGLRLRRQQQRSLR